MANLGPIIPTTYSITSTFKATPRILFIYPGEGVPGASLAKSLVCQVGERNVPKG